MSCGMNLPGRIGKLTGVQVKAIFPELRDALDTDLMGSIWNNVESARESRRLNETKHDHNGCVYGPKHTEVGWITAVDFRGALQREKDRHSRT